MKVEKVEEVEQVEQVEKVEKVEKMEKMEGSQRHLNPECCGSVMSPESKAKPGQVEEGKGDTPAPHSAADSHPQRENLSSCSAARVSFPPWGCQKLPSNTFQHGDPGAAIAQVQPSAGGVEPELSLLLLGAAWPGPQGHLHVSLWAWRGERQEPLSAH